MAATIPQTYFDTEKTVEDKVRNLPSNQGKNESAMWTLIDAEITQSIADGKLQRNMNRNNKHGN